MVRGGWARRICARGGWAWQGVVVNLRLDTAGARELGVETHVCELQLLLMSPEVTPPTPHPLDGAGGSMAHAAAGYPFPGEGLGRTVEEGHPWSAGSRTRRPVDLRAARDVMAAARLHAARDATTTTTAAAAAAQELAAADAAHSSYLDFRAVRGAALAAPRALARLWCRRPPAPPPPPTPAAVGPLPGGWHAWAAGAGAGARGVGGEAWQTYAQLTTQAGDRLTRRAGRIKAALHRLSPASVWFTRHPPSARPPARRQRTDAASADR